MICAKPAGWTGWCWVLWLLLLLCLVPVKVLGDAGVEAVADETVDRLRLRVSELESQLAETMLLLAMERAKVDSLQVRQEWMDVDDRLIADERDDGKPVGVLDVNRDLGLVVLNRGSQDGLKPGLVLAVLRDERVVARVRVVESRKAMSAARLEALEGDQYPQAGDRVTVWRNSR